MPRPHRTPADRARIAILLAAVLMLAAGCQATPCDDGDNSRFRCDPTAAAAS